MLPPPPQLNDLQSRFGLCTTVWAWSAICAFILVAILRRKNPNAKWQIFLAFLLSEATIFSIERANLIWFSAIGTALFFAFYDNTSKKKRILAAIGISIAIAFKVYPAIFLVLWLNKKDLKILAATILLSAIMGFAPLMFFQHTFIETICQLPANIKAQTDSYLIHSFYKAISPKAYLAAIPTYFFPIPQICMAALNTFCTLFGVLCLFVARKSRDEWVRLFLLAAAPIFIQAVTMYYGVLLFLPALYAFFNQTNKASPFDKCIAVLFALFLTPLQFATPTVMGITICLTPCLAMTLISAIAFSLIIRHFSNWLCTRRMGNLSQNG